MTSRYDRWGALLELLARAGEVGVEELASSLGVSGATVRRDLDELSRQQMLVRTRGGAVASNVSYDLPLTYKAARHAPEKQRIGLAAARLVAPGSTVALNGGTTSTEVGRALACRTDLRGDAGTPAVTVVTNALNIASELAVREQVKIVVTGGVVRPQSYELIGPLALPLLEGLALDYAILGADAIDAHDGASAHHEGEAAVSASMVERARAVVVVADSSKLGRRAFARVCPTSRIDVLVTSDGADEPTLDAFRARGTEVVVA